MSDQAAAAQQQPSDADAATPNEFAPHLLSPVVIGGDLALRNRVAMAPLTRGRSKLDRTPTDINLAYYEQRAKHTGLIIVEGTTIDDQFSNGWLKNAGIYTPEHVEGWKPITKAVHDQGAAIVCQLWHLGRAGHSSFLDGRQVVATSAIKIDGSRFGSDGVHTADKSKQPYEEPRELRTDEIPQLVDNYRRAAANALEAGFDGVEIHSANGYLLNGFLDTRTNKRTDQYSAESIDNRIRLLNEVIDACAESFPINRVGVRLSPNGIYNDMGSEDNVEVYTEVLKRLGKRGLLYTHVMDGLTFGFHQLTEPFTIAQMRAAYGSETLIANCGYTRETGDAVVKAGHADLVAYGRPFIGNPDLVHRFANDLPLADSNPATWFTNEAEGYSDYPTYEEQQALDAAKAAEGGGGDDAAAAAAAAAESGEGGGEAAAATEAAEADAN